MIALLLLFIITIIVDQVLIQPKYGLNQRYHIAIWLQLLIVSIIFSIGIILTQRIFFSMAVVLVIFSVIILINNAKYHTLTEPLVFSDLILFAQAFKYPRLYFPFINLKILITLLLLLFTVILVEWRYESPMQFSLLNHIQLIVINSIIALETVLLSIKQFGFISPQKNIQKYGLIVSLFIEWLHSLLPKNKQLFYQQLQNTPFAQLAAVSENSANIIVIQSESFFDIRRLYPHINSQILADYDRIKDQALLTGQLIVPAWGANTLRTEFSFLSGLTDQQLGLYKYYPYHYIQHSVFSIAHYLKQQGYYTVCIHPFYADFFQRKRVMPLLGFDQFIDICQFNNEKQKGYISDLILADKIIEIQKNSVKPVFIFAISIENHGPFHLESITDDEQRLLYHHYPNFAASDLSIYLRHLQNANAMIEKLTAYLQQQSTTNYLCFYGDHIPSLTQAYQALNFHHSETDYFIWANHFGQPTTQLLLSVEQLSQQLIKYALNPTKSFD